MTAEPVSNATKLSGLVQDLEIGEDPSDLYRQLRFALRNNQKTRVALLDQRISKAHVHYGRFYFYCIGDGCPACIEKAFAPRYLAWILVYDTDQNGLPRQPLQGSIKAWMFGRDKYAVLSALRAEWGDLRQVDMVVECTEEKYQRMSITAGRDCYWQKDEAFGMRMIEDFRKTRVDPIELIAKIVPREQMLGQMRQTPSSAPSPGSNGLAQRTDEDAVALATNNPGPSKTLQSLLDGIGAKASNG